MRCPLATPRAFCASDIARRQHLRRALRAFREEMGEVIRPDHRKSGNGIEKEEAHPVETGRRSRSEENVTESETGSIAIETASAPETETEMALLTITINITTSTAPALNKEERTLPPLLRARRGSSETRTSRRAVQAEGQRIDPTPGRRRRALTVVGRTETKMAGEMKILNEGRRGTT